MYCACSVEQNTRVVVAPWIYEGGLTADKYEYIWNFEISEISEIPNFSKFHIHICQQLNVIFIFAKRHIHICQKLNANLLVVERQILSLKIWKCRKCNIFYNSPSAGISTWISTCNIPLERKFHAESSHGVTGGSNSSQTAWSDSAYSTPERWYVKRRVSTPKYLRPKYMPQCRDVFTQKIKSNAYNPIHGWKAL